MTTVTRSEEDTAQDTGEAFGLPSPAKLRRLKLSREVAWYMVTRGYELPKHPPLIKTAEGSQVPGAVFDPDAVDKVLRSFSFLRHTQGALAGQPLNPDPWQIAYIIAPVFGWVQLNSAGDYVRVVSTLYVDVPRKNGKSTIAGGLALYLTGADGEQGAQVVAAASTKDQAGFVFAPVKGLAESAPALKGRFRSLTGKIIHPKSNSYFGVISSAADAQHGANIHGAIIDELHIHKTPDLVETLETGTGSRTQPLVCFITTADSGKPNTIYSRKRRYVEQLSKGVFKDPSWYGVVFALPDTADPLKPSNWAKANPGYPISPTHDALEKAARAARNSPAELAAFKRLHCGMRTRQTTAFLDLKAWDRNAGPKVTETDLAGAPAFGGLDLGSVSDLTALAWLFPDQEAGGYDLRFRFWTPEDNLDALDKRTAGAASKLWVPQGWLSLTPGNVTDYDFIKAQVLEDCETFDVQSIGIDRWNATQLSNDLLAEDVELVKVGQGYITMSPAMKELQRLVLKGTRKAPTLRHAGNPVARWMVDNLAVATDTAGNVKPDKAHSGDKIDGISALANAMSEALNTDRENTSDVEEISVA
ncbi:terminase large subunit [Nesterenkonia sp. E16_7]|nr:terminase large subunit [Nesterenkonia sp. E16_10]MBO0598358.1 terminase large subunit [Nesterenkonia sp. E16_7]